MRRELAEQQTQNDAQQRHVRQSIAALRLALDERPTQRQCADLASQTVARWVESDPGAEAWVRRAARSAWRVPVAIVASLGLASFTALRQQPARLPASR